MESALTFGDQPVILAGIPGHGDPMHLVRSAAMLLLGGFIGFSTTCGSLDLGGRTHVLEAGTPPADDQPDATSAPDFAAQRAWMVQLVQLEAELHQLTGVGGIDPRLLALMSHLPRI
jgi:hypothetical protein